ncbi:hypothetical protein BD309DRAFT_230326 [Dichomitus squalens]|nr:hypothetical protein BD309DRAFT_230326 [Dichomitus squalens]
MAGTNGYMPYQTHIEGMSGLPGQSAQGGRLLTGGMRSFTADVCSRTACKPTTLQKCAYSHSSPALVHGTDSSECRVVPFPNFVTRSGPKSSTGDPCRSSCRFGDVRSLFMCGRRHRR